MGTFQIIGLVVVALLGLYVFYSIYNSKANEKTLKNNNDKNLSALLLVAALFLGNSAWAQVTFDIKASYSGNTKKTTFTITRSGSSLPEQTINYRTVNLSAYAGQHYTAVNNTYTFPEGINTKTVEVKESTPGIDAYKFQNGTNRSYRFEVLDINGFQLAYYDRNMTTGTTVPTSGIFNEKTVTIQTGGYIVTDDGYINNACKYALSSNYFNNAAPKAYFQAIGAQLRMTLSLDAKEEDDGYQYLQILFDNTISCDSRPGNAFEPQNGNPGTPSLSRYTAGFEMNTGSLDDTYRNYSFPVTNVGSNEGATNPWGYGTTHPLKKQLFKSNFRASDGRLIVPTAIDTIVVRLNASGSGDDNWYAKNVNAHIQAVDATLPTLLNGTNGITVSSGPYVKGNTFYISVPLSEMVHVSGALKKLHTSWGDVEYVAGEYSNVITFKGTINASAGTTLAITGIENCLFNDLAGNYDTFSTSSFNKTFTGVTCSESYTLAATNTSFYTLNGDYWVSDNDHLPQPEPIVYFYKGLMNSSNRVTLTKNTNYTFSWSDNTAAGNGTVTATGAGNYNGSASTTFSIRWGTYNVSFHENGSTAILATGSMSNQNFQYGVAQNLSANTFSREGFTFAGWNTQPDGSGTAYNDGEAVTGLNPEDGGTVDLYAQWTPIPWTGSGDNAADPYVIIYASQLDLLSDNIRNGVSTYSGKFFQLDTDIVYVKTTDWYDVTSTEHNFNAIGTSTYKFEGTFDGNGNTISGIRIYMPNDECQGLFGYVNGGTVKNVTLRDTRIIGMKNSGGIVGFAQSSTIENCLAVNVDLKITENKTQVGIILGFNPNNNTLTGNHYFTCRLTKYDGTVNTTRIGTNSEDRAGARSVHYINLDSNITASGESVVVDNVTYYASNTTVTLGYTGTVNTGYDLAFTYNDGSNHAIKGLSFKMLAEDIIVSATLTDVWGVTNTPAADGSQDHPYMITSTTGLDLLAKNVNGTDGYTAKDFYNKYFKLDDDIAYSYEGLGENESNYTAIGYDNNHNFQGKFDGDGHTISGIRINTNNKYQGLFGYVCYGEINNVILANSIITGHENVGGIAGRTFGSYENNCRVESSVTIKAAKNAANGHGGIVGWKSSGTMSGCISAATISNNGMSNCGCYGGIVGQNAGDLKDCLYTGNSVTASNNYGSIVGKHDSSHTLANNYYTSGTLGGVNGSDCNGARRARVITLDEDITLAGDQTAYNLSGLTAIGTTVLSYNNGTTTTIYSGATQDVTLSYTGEPTIGYEFTGFTATNNGTINGNTLTMPDDDVVVSKTFIDLWGVTNTPAADGSQEHPYMITSTAGLDLLAKNVNGTDHHVANGFPGMFFNLGNDITYTHTTDWNDATSTENNYTAIGRIANSSINSFLGIFNGCGHTVSGIRIYKGGSSSDDSFQGLFGFTDIGTIKNVTLSDVRITGYQIVGGIVGVSNSNSNIENCFVISGAISGTNNVGAVVGIKDNSTLSHNYYHNCIVEVGGTSYTSEIGLGAPQGDYVNEVSPVYSLTPDTGIATTTTAAVTYNNVAYYTAGTTITLSYGGTVPVGYMVTYSYNDGTSHAVTGNSFTMPAANATVSATTIDVWGITNTPAADGSEEHPYMITTTAGLDLLATLVNAGNNFKDYFFKLGNDITYSYEGLGADESNYTAIGCFNNQEGYKPFAGTFNGCGFTVSGIRIRQGTEEYQGLFGILTGAVKNVTLTDAHITGKSSIGGIVGFSYQYSINHVIENCHVTSSVTLHSEVNNASKFGGIAGYFLDGAISGCSSAVNITMADGITGFSDCGGIVGDFMGIMQNCLVIGANIPDLQNYGNVTSAAIIGDYIPINSYTFSNNYYHDVTIGGATTDIGIGKDQSNQINTRHDVTDNYAAVPAYTLTLGDDISATSTDAVSHNSINYYPAGTTVTLSYGGTVPEGYLLTYSYNDGTSHAITGNSFEMPAANVTVSATTIDVWGITNTPAANGSEEHPYMITTTAGLDLLASEVNNGNSFYDTFFKLGADITYSYEGLGATESNYTPIGCVFNSSVRSFRGTFDGCGYTVSGIRIYRGGNHYYTDGHLGLFGYVLTGTVKNVTLSDARITGYCNVGGIAAELEDGGTVQNCHVTSTVALHAVQNNANTFGGIVGSIGSYVAPNPNYSHISVIDGCTSAATLTVADGLSGCNSFGGIAGDSYGTLQNCLVIGASIPTLHIHDQYDNDYDASGAIVGQYSDNNAFTLSHNYYHGVTIGNATTNIGIGNGNYNDLLHDITDNDGAVPVYTLTLGTGIATTTTAAASYNNIAYYTAGTEITLSYGGEVPAGYMVTYSYNDGTSHPVTGNSFEMPASDVTVSANFIIWEGSGTENDPWIINNKTQLDMLAICVNDNTSSSFSSNGFNGEFFKLGDDIAYDPTALDENGENYTAIGQYGTNNLFRGTFDGDNHTISGIRINKTGDDNADKCQGLFGEVVSATIRNVILDDVRVRGRNQVGGIVGSFSSQNNKIENCLVLNSQFFVKTTTANNCGAITGYSSPHLTLTNNYYYNCSVTQGTNTNTTNIGAGGYNVSDLDGARGVFTLTIGDDITANATVAVSHNNTDYYTAGTDVTLSYNSTVPDGCMLVYNVNGNAINGDSFEMPAADVIVSACLTVPYIDANGIEQYHTGITLIESSNSNVIYGTDNQEGWFVVSGDVNINGMLTIKGTSQHLILCDGATLTITNNNNHAIVSWGSSGTLTIYGQTNGTGTINATSTNTFSECIAVGGSLIINGGHVNASGSGGIEADSDITINGGNVHAIGGDYDGISSASAGITLGWRSISDRITASSYHYNYGGHHVTVKAGQRLSDGTAVYSGTLTSNQVYALAGKTLQPCFMLTLPDNVIVAAGAFSQDEIAYALPGTTVTLDAAPGFSLLNVTVNGNAATNNGDDTWSFEMPAADATVSATLGVTPWSGSGSENDPWIINYYTQLDMLASRVNTGNGDEYAKSGYDGKFFMLGNDIAYPYQTEWNNNNNEDNNYTAIGNLHGYFRGTFNGDGHTVSGIRIYKNGTNSNEDNNQGLFGIVDGGTVKNVTLSNTNIIGYSYTGGIVGYLNNGTIENCHVGDDVSIYANLHYGGGIVGQVYAGTVKNCLVTGATVYAGNFLGAIAGNKTENGTLIANYYHNSTAGIDNYTNVGCNGSDCPGARSVHRIYYLNNNTSAVGSETVEINNATYYAANTQVTLSYIGTVYENFVVKYKVNLDIISSNTFIMGNGDYQVGAIVEPDAVTWWHADAGHDGTSEGRAYIITSATGLNLLSKAEEVLTDYKDTYFKLGADIVYDPNTLTIDNNGDNVPESNYTAIGYTRPFQGCFDGQGHTVSGIRCTDNNHTGLFGVLVNNADSYVKNVTVADAVFNTTSTSCNSGGIVANLVQGSVTNCHAVGVRATVNEDANISTTVFAGALFGSCIHGIISDNYYYACSATKNGSLSSSNIGAGQCVMQGPTVYGDVTRRTYNNQTCTNCAVEGAGGLYILKGGNWNVASNWGEGQIAGSVNTAYIANNQGYIPNGCIAQADKVYVSGTTLDIEDGGQLITNNAVKATVEKAITGYGNGNDQWYFIASPVTEDLVSANVEGLVTSTEYDFYYLDEAATYWRNYKQQEGNLNTGFGIVHKQGYLYANQVGTTIQFEGTTQPFVNEGVSMTLTKEGDGWNLVGNPFTFNASVDKAYYSLDENGLAIPNTTTSANVPPCTGILVKADYSGEQITFTKPTAQSSTGNQGYMNIALTQANNRSQAILDKAMVSFDEGSELGKFYFGEQDANIYIPQDGKEYAIAHSDGIGEMPVCFKAKKNGEYTLTVSESLNSKFSILNYLHLIDNLTGADIDLLQTPSYTFTARSDDYPSRFKLVFSEDDNDGSGSPQENDFAFISDGNIIVTGTGTLQVIDMLGRQLFTREANSAFRIPHSAFSAGVYVLRLINRENVRTQKIIIK